MIAVYDLQKSYGRIHALKGVSFTVRPGECFACLGPNGAGKTTAMRIMTGLVRPDSGRVFVQGHDLLRNPAGKSAIGVVTQRVNMDQDLSVEQNLDIHGRFFGMDKRSRRERIKELLDRTGLAGLERATVKSLSGGMKRRAMIARALMHGPSVLFLDEPTVGLDADIRRSIRALLKDLQASGVTIFLTTHYIEEAEALAGRVAFLKEGEITALDTPGNLIRSLGAWMVADHDTTTASFHADRTTALSQAITRPNSTVGRTSLEDAYLHAMGSTSVERRREVGKNHA
ncbi:ABC transporter ATP-binding protein [Pseudodesulfovibrio karagichevae]|uniref:ABC transporter ATP-binding protein n=1 Tax=Pseudodesulfovibrio karagichevae TaxID=3239305 RepID=A0ABV4K238_9BACT